MDNRRGILIIACGALAREIATLRRMNRWTALEVRCLPAQLHNRPERIATAVRDEIRSQREHYRTLFVAYGDCGTGGQLDAVLREEGVERIPGAHCYDFFAGRKVFEELCEAEPGTFYLTDFLLRHFDRLVTRGLGLDRHPELASEYFRHYRKLVYLAQTQAPGAIERARQIAQRMGFEFEHRFTGYGELGQRLGRAAYERIEEPQDMASLIVISWRDIPAQVLVKRGRETAKAQLSPRFQEAVDRAAMRAGKGSSDAYLADWKRSPPRTCGDDIHAEVTAEAARLEASYTDEDLERLIRSKGLAGPAGT